jgi:N-acetylglucosamine-6-sulfatase
MRFPKLAAPGTKIASPVVSVDLAPTVLEVAGVEIPKHVQGKSLTPLLTGKADKVHDAILIEYYSHENPFPWTASLDYRIVRRGKYKYIRWIRFEDEAELYDMETDPYELNNLVNDPAVAAAVEQLTKDMQQLVLESLGLND